MLLASLVSPACQPLGGGHTHGVSHQPFCGDPARARLAGSPLVGGRVSAWMPLERRLLCLATLGGAGHQLGAGQEACGLWLPHKHWARCLLGWVAGEPGWGPSQASLSQQPCGLRCLHFLTPQLRHCARARLCCVWIRLPTWAQPSCLPAGAPAHAFSVTGLPLFPTADFSHSAAQDMFGAAHAPVRGLRIADTAVGWGSAPPAPGPRTSGRLAAVAGPGTEHSVLDAVLRGAGRALGSPCCPEPCPRDLSGLWGGALPPRPQGPGRSVGQGFLPHE